MAVNQQMREEWNRRAREDAHFYAGFARLQQRSDEFLTSAAETVAKLEGELARLPEGAPQSRRALEIGCGPGRLMLPMSTHFGEIHGVDVSEEMIALARKSLKQVPHAHVHATSGSDLAIFGDEFFDFVFSYIVFQHIPDREIVLTYLRESRRVLKAGGVLCCQLRGAPALPSELERESATWTGCYFSGNEVIEFSRENTFHLVVLEGLETQYLWTTWIKPARGAGTDFSRFQLKAVTAAANGEDRVPARGRDATVSLWIDGLPISCHLGNLQVTFNGIATPGCYLSPIGATGACQLNAQLPRELGAGRCTVAVSYDAVELGERGAIQITPPPPRQPRVLTISDGINITSKNRVETGGMKVTIEDIERPEEVAFHVADRPVEFLQYERKDPVTDTYEFAFHLSPKTSSGTQQLRITVLGGELPHERIEIVGRQREATSWRRFLKMWRLDQS